MTIIIYIINAVAVLQQLCVHMCIVFLLLYLHFTLGLLHESDLGTLMEEMSNISTKWESVGRELFNRSDHKYLTNIYTSYITSYDCMREVLRKWLQINYYFHSWGTITHALRNAGESQVADNLKAKYIPGELTTIILTQYSLQSQHGGNGMI